MRNSGLGDEADGGDLSANVLCGGLNKTGVVMASNLNRTPEVREGDFSEM